MISIITVVRNGRACIRNALESVRSQQAVEVEHIVVDGASTDDTVAIIREFERNHFHWISEPDEGIYDAMNKGIAMAHGEWVLFLGADDVLSDPLVLAESLLGKSLENHVLVCGVVRDVSGRQFPPSLGLCTMIGNTIHHQAAFYRRSLFETFRYRTDVPVVADYELNFLLHIGSQPVLFLDREIAVVGDQGVSRTASRLLAQINFYKMRQRHLGAWRNILYLFVGLSALPLTSIKRSFQTLFRSKNCGT